MQLHLSNANIFRFSGPNASWGTAPPSRALLLIPFRQSKQWAILSSERLLLVSSQFLLCFVFYWRGLLVVPSLYEEKLIALLANTPFQKH